MLTEAPASIAGAQSQYQPGRYRAWFRTLKTSASVHQRIFCLPHAGGTASFFRNWADALPQGTELIAIQYPGREERLEEACIDNMQDLVSGIEQSLSMQPHLLQKPYLIFGHSMGAAVAYELCLRLQQNQRRLPCHLVVSASEGPGRIQPSAFHQGSDKDLLQEIIRLNDQLTYLAEVPELTDMIMPMLKTDYRLIETYGGQVPSMAQVEMPITAMTGQQDTELTYADAEAWADVSQGDFQLHSWPGDHFYLSQQYKEMIPVLLRLLKDSGAVQYPAWGALP
ncbi:thioesterase II family protein [Oceanospirillum sediminis]|uniref:Thioesterase n=1 Tax=Oceanospirillum sediminis TaxID=2760088 RepID=A0A839INB4_9GAMM|nr:alpha/beta fold hydrolase [Oceanospirillum sediminis]MBB1485776.1 thioesterase [Oceanospirillum sediminis]